MMFTGKPDVNLNDATLVAAGLTQTQINAEKDKIKNDAMDFFPIVKLGLGYTF